MTSDTIFAVSTASGKAGIAVIRVSGPDAWSSAMRLCGTLPAVRKAGLRDIRDPETGELIDTGVVLCFDTGHSYTGEKTVEYQIHGSYATANSLIEALSRQPDHRAASPGEFSNRALLNGELDLVQLEGLADLIDAETASQKRLAQQVFRGAFSDLAGQLRKDLVRSLALVEATLDFSDEDLGEDLERDIRDCLTRVAERLEEQIKGARAARAIRDGFEVALVGRPNVGKSTLLNAIAGREAALTSSTAGTTRDVIEVRLDLGGMAVTLLDMAGIRDADEDVELLGVHLARRRADKADLRVFITVDGEPVDLGIERRPDDILVTGMADLVSRGDEDTNICVSGKTGVGIEDLLGEITRVLADRGSGASFLVRQRHLDEMKAAKVAVGDALGHIVAGEHCFDIAADDLRHAIRSLDRIVGRVDVEDLLDDIFSSFCIGK